MLGISGSSLNKTLKVSLFISNSKDIEKVNEMYSKYFTNQPARSFVVFEFPSPNLKIELGLPMIHFQLRI